MSLIESLLTGEWKMQRAQMRERVAYLEATRDMRVKMLQNGVANATLQHMQLYAAANPGTARPYPSPLSNPDDWKPAYERIVLIRGARQMEEDLAFPDAILDEFETYVVGEQLVYFPNTGNTEANKVIREYVEWQSAEADYAEQDDLTKIAQLGIRGMKRDGEDGFNFVDVGDAIKIRSVSGDCIGNPTMAAGTGANDYGGILVDPTTKAPVQFNIFKRVLKTNSYVFDYSLPADQFRHYKDKFRTVQYHGVSIFKNALADYYDIQQIMEFSKLNVKWRSSQLPTVHTETGRPRGAGIGWFGYGNNGQGGTPPVTTTGAPMPMQTNVDGVTMNYMKLDEMVMDYPHDFPNQQLLVLIDELNRRCAKGAKLPIEFVYKAAAGGVIQRFFANKAEQTFNKDKHLLRRTLLNPYKNRVIDKGIQTGELDLRAFGDLAVSDARFKGRWQMGRAISVDYGNETSADIKLIEAGLMSPADKVADNGGNIDDVMEEIEAHAMSLFKAADRVSKATKNNKDIVLPYLEKKFPNPGAGLKAGDDAQTQDTTNGSTVVDLARMEAAKAQADAYGVAVRAGAITPTKEDEIAFRKLIGMPEITPDVAKEWDEEPTRRPITITNPDGSRTAPGGGAPTDANKD